ncbi:hypothetical protein CAEBREN_01564 [Caenorhabditis brenneri]|uniref:F-box domain-containing protein n=1 Tax=Caenorhabditis brenneri TaxID=135651 RepID=G0MC09_CAEBE|nr:hypothetical protein CAEBREN_01564 [Caenorhabditis brenneri]
MNGSHQPTFRLLRLPVNDRKNVLRNMRVIDTWSISLCSKATKVLSMSINLKPKNCHLHLFQFVDFKLNFQDFIVHLQISPTREEQQVHDERHAHAIVTYTRGLDSESRVYRSSFTTAEDWDFYRMNSTRTGNRLVRLTIKGGIEIRRYDGTCVTVFVKSANDRTGFELFVWS